MWTATVSLALVAACSGSEESAASTAATTTASATPPASPAPPSPAPGKVAFEDNETKGTGDTAPSRDFAYSWPAAVAAVPELAARFTAERDRLLAEQKSDWQAALKEFADENCGGCVNREFAKTWEVVADIPGFLSLSQSFSEYSGGAHGNYGSGGLVWDRAAKQALSPEDLFVSEKALQDVLGTRWCKTLAAERRKRFGADPGDDSVFPCPPVKDLTLLLGSKSKTHFDRIGLIADPYVAGSYAEGAYEITLPVTAEVLTAVKPRYRNAFARGE
ncbi:PdaC/SigV domain-containing protein [Erythrobacter sp. NE805]|uniref:PdaC/SigV domain-containing protein n=1 Tax=Erythrobacter sp. NE805 TaxID=3389875 RepID=UPI00396B2BA0